MAASDRGFYSAKVSKSRLEKQIQGGRKAAHWLPLLLQQYPAKHHKEGRVFGACGSRVESTIAKKSQ